MKTRAMMIAAAAAGVFATAPAQAAVTFYTTQASFNAATVNPRATETFETAPYGGTTWYPYGYTGNGFTAVGDKFYTFTVDVDRPAWYNLGSGDSLLYGPSGKVTFYFNQIVTAFSIDLATYLNDGGAVTVAGTGFSTIVNTARAPTRTFFGLTSDVGLSGFTLTVSGTNNGLADNFTIASIAPVSAVPEPAAWAMMLVSFGFIGAAARYRRSRTTIAYA